MQNQCTASSGPLVTPVLELYTSEGCSSCPPADQWASSFKGKKVVVQAFHVGYWDYIGWVDRFATPAYTQRQRDVAAKNRLRNIYTPQVVLDGRDWPQWQGASSGVTTGRETAQLQLMIRRLADDQFEATVTPSGAGAGAPAWAAYWTVTEHGHHSSVKAGENAGEFLKHDFVVRQYTPAGEYTSSDASPKRLGLRSIAATPGHERQVNLVVFEPRSGKTLQALSLQCPPG
ncbi:MAG: DUF1223 domain-containing protein [Polaromonas sp.]|uniref:DUF1223 domain-containing protein n=1 Tax=Polaromonas sp. TaxID=1869339 RepID=UPI002487997A|nr:DUF1223 domain-containing protein [Polaromonas sp.]MDI1238215.1 DUF1223 domain-containing protein [Polaromonas sp.]